MRDDMSVSGGGSRVAPSASRHKPLQISPAKPPHPRRPCVAERVKRHPGQPIGRDYHALSALRPLDGRQPARRDLSVEKNKIPVSTLVKRVLEARA
jgi:hypothetical protein